MARHARMVSYTDYYHVMVRGNNKEAIFVNSFDKKAYLKKLYEVEDKGLINLAGWCVMDNHVHLLVKADLDELGTAMQMINTKYAMRMNRKYGSVGHVFQDRFKSEVIHSDEHLLMVLRYIHQNPVKAAIVNEVARYDWSSYHSYFEDGEHLSRDFIMSLFKHDKKKYIEFHKTSDNRVYLDVKEDMNNQRYNRAIEIIKIIAEKNGYDSQDYLSNKKVSKDIVFSLIRETDLSKKSISRLTKCSYNSVRKWAKDV